MRTRRRAVFRASAVITTAALAAAFAPAAFADTTQETVSRIVTGDDGSVTVTMSGGVQPLWSRISVRSSAAADATTLFSTDDTTTPALVSLPAGTGYGDYPVDVDFRLPGGPTQHWAGADHGAAGLLNYRRHASVSGLAFDRATTDYDHRTAVLTGTVQVLDPATGDEVTPAAGTQVRIAYDTVGVNGSQTGHTVLAGTDTAGAFRLPLTPDGTLYGRTAVVASTAPDTTATQPVGVPSVTADVTAYRISAAASRTVVHKGDKFTISGSVQRLTGTGWLPFAGASVVTTAVDPTPYNTGNPPVSATTAANGGFSYQVTATNTRSYYTFVKLSPYLQLARDANSVQVPTPGTITLAAYSIDRYGLVKTTGRLNGNCSEQSLWLQYSPNGKTGWLNISHLTTGWTSGGYCSYFMSGYGAYDGYYRVYHAENAQLLGVTSPVHRLKRTRTAVSVAMTPGRPHLNAKLTASGVVTQYVSGHWVHYAKAHVVLVYRPKGDPQWYWVVKGYTDSAGRYTLNTKAYGDGTWGVYVDADSTHFYSESKDVYVDVR